MEKVVTCYMTHIEHMKIDKMYMIILVTETWLTYAGHMPNTCQAHVRDMPNISPTHFRIFEYAHRRTPKTCPTNTENMYNICPIHAPNMPDSYPKLVLPM